MKVTAQDNEQENLINYGNYVKKIFEKGEPEFFANKEPEHAMIVLTELFKHSKEIKMFYSIFDEDIFLNNKVKSLFEEFLENPKNQMTLVISNIENISNRAYFFLKKLFKKYPKLRIFDTKNKIHFEQNGKNRFVNIIIGDGNKMRQEFFDKEFHITTAYNSIFKLNDVEKMDRIFDEAYHKSKKYLILT